MIDLPIQQLSTQEWHEKQENHEKRASVLTADQLARRKAGIKHPVFDFLYEYYPVRIAHLAKWHPGLGYALEAPAEQENWKFYTTTEAGVHLDIAAFLAKKRNTINYIYQLLTNTMSNPAHFDCFGLHEWAMVYKAEKPRHDLPLRLGKEETNRVVEENDIRCTHYDAYRFFTKPAIPLNFTVLRREDQPENDQRGCLHATMDLYKWATKLGPVVPGNLWLDTFELAHKARILDMEASPYDCREYGLGVVKIETPQGKSEYVHRQRELAHEGTILRKRLVELIQPLLSLE